MMVAALFVRKDSVYKSMTGVDAWDAERDARNWPGGDSVVAHPPCAQWAGLSHMAKVNPQEKRLALIAIDMVRDWGGVLEHPVKSKLWAYLPAPGEPMDQYGGWSMVVSQKWWGHMAEKLTLLYVVGITPDRVPPVPLTLGAAEFTCGISGRRKDGTRKPGKEMPKSQRDYTPPAFAAWLVELAHRCSTRFQPGFHIADTRSQPGNSQSAKAGVE